MYSPNSSGTMSENSTIIPGPHRSENIGDLPEHSYTNLIYGVVKPGLYDNGVQTDVSVTHSAVGDNQLSSISSGASVTFTHGIDYFMSTVENPESFEPPRAGTMSTPDIRRVKQDGTVKRYGLMMENISQGTAKFDDENTQYECRPHTA